MVDRARTFWTKARSAIPWLSPRSRHPLPRRRDGGAAEKLEAHGLELRRDIVEVVPGVHVAIGFGLANSVLLEGTDGVVIVDTLESDEAALLVKQEFSRICNKPVKALIYTHNHADHVFGSQAMAGDDHPEVIAHASTRDCVLRVTSVIRPAIFTRSMRQFGTLLGEDDHLNSGIGPRLAFDGSTAPSVLWPTRTFEDHLELEIAGLSMRLFHAPGETPDQICVWLPHERLLIPGDNFYHAFPNLYAIRGTAHRDVMSWVKSLDRMIDLDADTLVPCHTRPIVGRERIRETLTNYRDAIQYVHDQTVRGLNRGMTVDEIVSEVSLPSHLATQPYLQEFYGTVEWSVRAIFHGHLGWFDGDAVKLHPLSPRDRAGHMVDLAGGRRELLDRARRALRAGEAQWAVELAGHLLALDSHDREAATVRADSLRALAERATSANGRNYYLTQAREAEGSIPTPVSNPKVSSANMLSSVPMESVFRGMAVSLDGPASGNEDTRIGFRFSDSDEDWILHVRRGVAKVTRGRSSRVDIQVTTSSLVWKELLIGRRHPLVTLAGSDVRIEGSRVRLIRCLRLFRPSG